MRAHRDCDGLIQQIESGRLDVFGPFRALRHLDDAALVRARGSAMLTPP